MTSNIIPNDGYTEAGYFAERRGLNTAIHFRYRPLTHSQRYATQDVLAKRTGTPQSLAVHATVAKQVVEWDLVDAAGNPLPITPQTVASVKPQIVERLFSCVMGYEAGDLDASDSGAKDAFTLELEAAAAGETIGAHREAVNEKN